MPRRVHVSIPQRAPAALATGTAPVRKRSNRRIVDPQPQIDPQAQIDRTTRIGHHFSRIRVSAPPADRPPLGAATGGVAGPIQPVVIQLKGKPKPPREWVGHPTEEEKKEILQSARVRKIQEKDRKRNRNRRRRARRAEGASGSGLGTESRSPSPVPAEPGPEPISPDPLLPLPSPRQPTPPASPRRSEVQEPDRPEEISPPPSPRQPEVQDESNRPGPLPDERRLHQPGPGPPSPAPLGPDPVPMPGPSVSGPQGLEPVEVESGPETSEGFEDLAELVSKGTSISGLFGTGGTGNTGYVDVGPKLKDKFADVKTALGTDAANRLSGASDMVGSAFEAGSDLLSLAKAGKAWKEAGEAEDPKLAKAKVAAETGASAAGVASGVAKFLGGAATAQQETGDDTTRVKQVGDILGIAADTANLGAGIVGGVSDFRQHLRDENEGVYASKAKGGKGWFGRLRAWGRGLRSGTKLTASGVGIAKESAKIVGQIQGHGHLVAGAAATTATGLSAAGAGLGIATGAMETIGGLSKFIKSHQRSGRIAADLKDESLSDQHRAALQHLQEIQSQKKKTGGLKIASGALTAVAAGLTLSGHGTIPGLVLGGLVAGGKLGNWGYQKLKQRQREKAAKSDQAQNQSYAQWKAQEKERIGRLSGFKKLKAKAALKFTGNWDKTKAKKAERYNATAEALMDMDNDKIQKYLGLTKSQLDKLDAPDARQKKKERIVKALQKR